MQTCSITLLFPNTFSLSFTASIIYFSLSISCFLNITGLWNWNGSFFSSMLKSLIYNLCTDMPSIQGSIKLRNVLKEKQTIFALSVFMKQYKFAAIILKYSNNEKNNKITVEKYLQINRTTISY